MNPGFAPTAPAAIFTTRGFLPAAQVELRSSVVEDTADRTVTRIDKFDRADNAWVGNDLDIKVHRLPALFSEAGAFA